jgi:putative transposase
MGRQDEDERPTWSARLRRRKVGARTHERIRWRRDNCTHQASRRLVHALDVRARDYVSVRNLMANHPLATSIHDAAWTAFAAQIACKAGWAGRREVAVNPAETRQAGSGGGHRTTDLTRADRTYTCLRCGLGMDRDRNAAWNILARGRQAITT